MERNKLAIVIVGGALLSAFIVYGGLVTNAKITDYRKQIVEQTQRGDELVVTLKGYEDALVNKKEELTTLQEKYGLAVTDKTKAEQDAATQKSAAATSASEATKQKGIATTANANLSVCTNNKDALANVAYYMAQQRTSYGSSTYYLAQAAIEYIDGNYTLGNSYIDSATYYQNQAEGYDSTISYWIDQIK